MPLFPKPPAHFPGSERLGPTGQALLERVFPTEPSIPVPATTVGPEATSLANQAGYYRQLLRNVIPDMTFPKPMSDTVRPYSPGVAAWIEQLYNEIPDNLTRKSSKAAANLAVGSDAHYMDEHGLKHAIDGLAKFFTSSRFEPK